MPTARYRRHEWRRQRFTLASTGVLRRQEGRPNRISVKALMSEIRLTSLTTGFSCPDHRRARARGQEPGPVLARRLQVRHEGHESRSAGPLGRKRGPRLRAVRLFRPRRIGRRVHRRHDRPVAGGKSRGLCALRQGPAGGDRVIHGRLAGAAVGARTVPNKRARRRSPAWC